MFFPIHSDKIAKILLYLKSPPKFPLKMPAKGQQRASPGHWAATDFPSEVFLELSKVYCNNELDFDCLCERLGRGMNIFSSSTLLPPHACKRVRLDKSDDLKDLHRSGG